MANDEQVIDGRRARRDRNRRRVLDAIIELIEEGDPLPTVAVIADRSGMSHRSVFRYFDDLDTLFSEALSVAYERIAPLSSIHHFARGTQKQRIDNLVDQRIRLFSAIVPLARSARQRRGAGPHAEAALSLAFGPLRDQLAEHFASEIDTVPKRRREAVLDALGALLSFESYESLRNGGLDEAGIRAAYAEGIRRLLR